MSNNFKDTNIYGNLTVKPLYQTYSNIGVSSGNVTVPAYFQNTGNTSLNNLSVSGSFNSTGNITLTSGTNTSAGVYLGKTTNLIYGYNDNLGIRCEGDFYFENSTNSSIMNLNGQTSTLTVYNMVVNSKLGILTTTPTEVLDVNGTAHIRGSSLFLGSGKTNLIYTDTNNPQEMVIQTKGQIYFNTGIDGVGSTPTTKLKINGDGKIGIGTFSPTEALDVVGNVKCTYLKTSSDYRLKQSIQPLNGNYDITKLNPVSYNMGGCKSTGFIAHELQEVFPHLVTGEKDGETMQSIDYIGLIAILTQNLQKLQKEVNELKCKLNI